MFKKAPKLEYNIHQQQDNIQDSIVQLQSKFDQLEQLQKVFKNTQSSIIHLTIQRLKKQLEKDITDLLMKGVNPFLIMSEMGGKLYEANILSAKNTIKAQQDLEGNDIELDDYVDEDSQLNKHNQIMNQKQINNKIEDIEYQQLLKGKKIGLGQKAGLHQKLKYPNQQTKLQKMQSLISQFQNIKPGEEVPQDLIKELHKMPIDNDLKRQIISKVQYRERRIAPEEHVDVRHKKLLDVDSQSEEEERKSILHDSEEEKGEESKITPFTTSEQLNKYKFVKKLGYEFINKLSNKIKTDKELQQVEDMLTRLQNHSSWSKVYNGTTKTFINNLTSKKTFESAIKSLPQHLKSEFEQGFNHEMDADVIKARQELNSNKTRSKSVKTKQKKQMIKPQK